MFTRDRKRAGSLNRPSGKGFIRVVNALLSRDKLGELMVLSGRMTAMELREALLFQKKVNLPLGQILVDRYYITKYQLRLLLWRQRALRFMAASFLLVTALTGMTKKSRADLIEDIPAKISVAQVSPSVHFETLDRAPALFGSEEKRSDNMKAFTKWIGVFEKFDNSLKNTATQKIVRDMQEELVKYKSDSIFKMADKVNMMMNRQSYILDKKNWGKSDYWETPAEFMVKGGDCEDFSIAKYFALRALGVPESRLRVAIVHDEQKNMPHAVLIVYAETGPVVLDNQSDKVLSASSISHYRPIYSINRQAWWLHTKPEVTVVASAR